MILGVFLSMFIFRGVVMILGVLLMFIYKRSSDDTRSVTYLCLQEE